ncbi:sel1 repeat family protein [Luteibacter yeojuensis]|uniref:sel1 repeat family protein n=1 Tax=Luteibacter yeojuensis TaxID=345309 RepID=UPI00069861AF|nr:sel1 repeat family protein [Luteibacter yeojuensis]
MSMHRMAMAVAFLVAASALPALAADKPQPLPGQDQRVVANALRECPTALERFLPGDYYYCDATRNFWSGRDDAARASLKNAAAWANKPAQYALGIMYFNGDHAEKNRALGLAWLGVANERHDPEVQAAFMDAYRRVTPEEMAQADAYYRELKATYADKVAAPRASKRFDRAYSDLFYAVNFGGSVFIDGLAGLPMSDGIDQNNPENGTSGFVIGRMLQERKATALAGWQETVTVGDPTLVPVSQVIQRQ